MKFKIDENGSVTSVPGFLAAGVAAGFKRSGAPDFALVAADAPCHFAGVFTSCRFAAAPVLLDREKVRTEPFARAVALNSGNANACTGAAGLENARESCRMVGEALGIPAAEVLVCSTGRIGVQMPMDVERRGVEMAARALSRTGGTDAARAVMTTDTVPKHAAVQIGIGGKTVTLGAMTKGAGMIDPRLTSPHATMLCTVVTDAAAENSLLQAMLDACAPDSFNRITVDGDMSTNDTVLLLANGQSGVTLEAGTAAAAEFQEALLALMRNLARRMVLDGEGATKFVTVEVCRAGTAADAKLAAEAVANSLLCKTAWYGNDPNWGRVVAALGYSGANFNPDNVNIWYDAMPVVRNGGDAGTTESELAAVVGKREFTVKIDLGSGDAGYWVWTSDISHEYVKINADYHT